MTRVALAVDFGGTKVEAALVDQSGQVRENSRNRVPTGPDITPEALREALAVITAGARAALGPGDELVGVGIGSAGPIDRVAGTITPSNNPLLVAFPMRGAVEEAVGADVGPVTLAHDGGCLALAESWLGATQGARSSLSMVVSTGIGGGFVYEGTYQPGATGNAGHLGQMRPDGTEFLERMAAGPASVAWAQEQGWEGHSGEDLARSVAAGDPIAREAVERSARLVGHALADAATLVDLDVIAIGGGFSFVSEDYADLVQAALRERAPHAYSRATRVVRAALGGDGPLIGAAALALR